ncbi:hypothetical protein SDC9_134334 [bioreactor metagenome]|uniref:Uncharacterized protein n=1 Tax=bioreactor metagenome TaxID=1076179 RepID=A0A645DDC0_9ZZZZ
MPRPHVHSGSRLLHDEVVTHHQQRRPEYTVEQVAPQRGEDGGGEIDHQYPVKADKRWRAGDLWTQSFAVEVAAEQRTCVDAPHLYQEAGCENQEVKEYPVELSSLAAVTVIPDEQKQREQQYQRRQLHEDPVREGNTESGDSHGIDHHDAAGHLFFLAGIFCHVPAERLKINLNHSVK